MSVSSISLALLTLASTIVVSTPAMAQKQAGVATQNPGIQLQVPGWTVGLYSMSSVSVPVVATLQGGVTVPTSGAGAAPSVVSGLPTGLTAKWSNPTVTGSTVTWTLTLTGSTSAVGSSGTLVVSAQVTDATTGKVYIASQGMAINVILTPPTLSMSAALTQIPLVRGTTATDVISIKTGGSFHGNVTLSVTGMPSGVTAAWSSNPVTVSSNAGASTLALTAGTSVPLAWYTITVTATGDGLTTSQNYTVMLQQAPAVLLQVPGWTVGLSSMGTVSVSISANLQGGVTVPTSGAGAAPSVVSGLPTGLTAKWSNPTVTGSTVTWTLTLAGSTSAVGSSGILVVSAQVTDAATGKVYIASQGMAINVILTPPTLSMSAALTQIPLVRGTTASDVISIKTGGSFHGNVTLSASGMPSGVTAAWSSNPVTVGSNAGASTLTLTAGTSVPLAWYTITVTATGDGLTTSQNYTVMLQQAPGVLLQVPGWAVGLYSMGTVSVSIVANLQGGVTVPTSGAGAVPSVVSGLPTGLTAKWSNPIVNGTMVTWTLTLTGSTSAVGSSGTLVVSAQVTDATTGKVYIASQGMAINVIFTPPTLSIAAAATKVALFQGASVTDAFTFTGGGSYQGNVTLSVSGMPSGVAASWSNNPVVMNSNTGTSTLTLTAASTTPLNWYAITVVATGDGLSLTRSYTLMTEPSTGVVIQLPSSAVTLNPGETTSLLVTAQPIHGVAVQSGAAGTSVSLNSALPSGVTGNWSQPTVTSAGAVTWTLALSAGNAAEAGDYPFSLSVTVTDKASGAVFSATQQASLLVSLLADVTIGSTPGITVPSNFMGLSHEWGNAQSIMGKSSTGINTIYRQLLTNLAAYGSDPIVLRIGGNTTDLTGEPTAGVVEPFAEVATALGSHFLLGVNLGSDNVNLAKDQAQAYLSQMPIGSVVSLEIGNEPDLYATNGTRTSSYTVQDYFDDFDNWRTNIEPVLTSGTKFAGATWANLAMLPSLSAFESREQGHLNAATQHFYVTGPSSTLPDDLLLADTSATSGVATVTSPVTLTHANGLSFRLGEMSSIYGAGVDGISNAFGSALWSIDAMFEFANAGVDGVNWETSDGNISGPFYFYQSTSKGITSYTLKSVNPLYYGMLLFQAATPNHSQILPATITTPANLKAWPTIDASGRPRLSLLNKDKSQSGTVQVTLAGYNQATVTRLSAPSYQSSSSITLGGQTFDGSTDGRLQGQQTSETVEGTNGVFAIPMPATSAALVVFAK